MSVLARYIVRAVVGYTGLVLLILATLSSLYLFYSQQDDIGTGDFGVTQALMFVALSLPQQVFEMIPIAALIGALLGLGNLARSGELIVMRASGVSVFRIAAWVGLGGLILMLLAATLGELVAPNLERYARQMKTFAKYRDVSLTGDRNAWAKDGDTIISVREQSAENEFGGVLIFELNPQRRLQSVSRASSATLDGDRLNLRNFATSHIEGDTVRATREATATIATRLSKEFVGLAAVDPDGLPVRGLMTYIRHLQLNGLESQRYEVGLWSRVARTFAIAIIVMLAVPFVFGPMRSTGTGARTVIGILVGAIFFLVARTFESGGAVFGLHPFVIGWAPVWLLMAVTAAALARVR
jgi:lipopolysaccharide export system permease protein